MADTFRLTLAQLNPTVGDIAGNAAPGARGLGRGRARGADWWRCPRCSSPATTAGPGDETRLSPAAMRGGRGAGRRLRRRPGAGHRRALGSRAAAFYNAYFILRGRAVAARVLKHHLPNETVFDEVRFMTRAPRRALRGGQHPHRLADLRGRLARRCGRNAGRDRRRDSCSCPTARPITAASSTRA
jgi:NAD+ synthase